MSAGDVVIRAEGLSKRYRLGARSTHGRTLGEMLYDTAGGMVQRLTGRAAPQPQRPEFWALKNVSFEVRRGEVLGIIGRNGAGKSTLLKILARITDPTAGRAALRGKVGSLLEVGTGFHPELSGRENIYLNGTVLGMSRREIAAKFDQIVDFAEIAEFLDTPVKRYSSGMYVRLAFAVAAHLEPQILIVDEVLAVGDTSFQKKCLGKMKNVAAQEGRTVLFVSHNMGAVVDLCDRALFLRQGRVTALGPCSRIMQAYLDEEAHDQHVRFDTDEGAGNHRADPDAARHPRFTYARTLDQQGRPCAHFPFGAPVRLRLGIRAARAETLIAGLTVRDVMGRLVLHLSNLDDRFDVTIGPGEQSLELSFRNILNSGSYYLTLWLGNTRKEPYHYATDCLRIASDTSLRGSSLLKGMVIIPGRWSNVADDAARLAA